MNKRKKGTGLTKEAKIKQIRSGRATLVDDLALGSYESNYNSAVTVLNKLFTFETTDKQKEKIAFNEGIDRATDEMHTTVELAGARLVDMVVLDAIPQAELP